MGEDYDFVMKLNEEMGGKVENDNDALSKTIEDMNKMLNDLSNKEKEDFDVVIKLNEDNKENMHNNNEKLLKELEQKMNSFKDSLEITLNHSKEGTENKLESIEKEIEGRLKAMIEEQKEQKEEILNAAEEFESINSALENMKDSMNNLKSSIDDEVKVTISTNMDNIDNKIGNIQETILKHQADIVNIQETSSFHTETAKYVDRLSTRMDSIDEERKKTEAEMIAQNEKLY